MRVGFSVVVASLLAGCGPNLVETSQDYFDAQIGCIEEAYGDDQAAVDAAKAAYPDTYCDAYEGIKGAEADAAADLFDCYATAVDAADCSTAEGYSALGTELLACVGG